MGETLRVDLNEWTVDDLIDFETEVGKSVFEVFPAPKKGQRNAETTVPMKTLKVLVWIVKRGENPDFTLEAAGKEKLGIFTGLEVIGLKDPNPTNAAGSKR